MHDYANFASADKKSTIFHIMILLRKIFYSLLMFGSENAGEFSCAQDIFD